MASKLERENFYRGSTLIVDNTRKSFVVLLELHLSRSNLSFEDFINQNQHNIYHLFYNSRNCCKCTPGYVRPNNRILHYSQLEVLFDKYAKKPSHRLGNRSDFCCAKAKTGITTDLLDITLTRTLLVNLCHDVFWYSCLNLQSQSLEDFLNKNKHTIYHLREPNVLCCQCPPGFIFQVTGQLLDLQSWKFLFNLPELPCSLHRIVPSDFVCTVSASRGIDVRHLSDNLTKLLIEQCCPLRKTIDMLIQIRNKIQGHASEGRISDADYGGYILDIESGILEIAKVCKNEVAAKQSLSDLKQRSLDETLCIQYQNMLLEQIQKEKRLEEKIDDIEVQLPEKIKQAVNKAFSSTIPDLVAKSVQSAIHKVYEPNSKLTIDKQRLKKKLLEDTLTLIKLYSSEDTFVETDVIYVALNELDDKGIIVLTGTAGAGKSRNSLEILQRFTTAHDGYCGIKLNNISEWNDVINNGDRLIVVVDDIFGRTNCIFNAEEEKVFDNIYSMVSHGCVKVICTMRNTIQSDNQVSEIIDRNRIFKQSRFIDLSSTEFEMKGNQKRDCLLKYCKFNNILISVSNQIHDDKHVLDPLVPTLLSVEETYKIAYTDINPLIGYPQSCFLFTSNRKFTRLGVGFFKHPTKSLCNEIENLRNAGYSNEAEALQYAILVYMALNEDCLDPHDIKLHTFNKVHELLYHKKEFTAVNIRRGIGNLTMRYLRTNPNGTYSFQHRSILESVLLTYNDIKTESLVPLLHIDFIFEMGRLDGYIPQPGLENEVSMLFDKCMYSMLAKKIIAELMKNNSTEVFIERLCSSRIIRNADEYFIDELYKEYILTKCAICCTICHLDSEEGLERHSFKFDKIYTPSKRTSVSFLTLILKYSMSYVDNDNTIRHILDLMQHELYKEKKIYINEDHEKCFTKVILQSCAYLNKPRLDILWNFMKKNGIRFDKETFLSFCLGFDQTRKLSALKLLSSTVLTSDLMNSNDLLTKALEVNNAGLIELIFKQQDSSKIDIPLAVYNACAQGALVIVQWFLKKFKQEKFDIKKSLVSCSRGCIYPPIETNSSEISRSRNSEKVVAFLLKTFRISIPTLNHAMSIALFHSNFNICKILLEKTTNVFNAEAILYQIAVSEEYYKVSECFTFVKYLVTVYSCFNVSTLLKIADKMFQNFHIVKWIMSISDNELFYMASKNHHWIHKEICAFKLIYGSKFYKSLDETAIIFEELRYGNNDCLRFLLHKVDMKRAEKEIIEKACSCGDVNLMQIAFEKYGSSDITHTMNIAVEKNNLEAVKWMYTNVDVEQLDFESFIKAAITRGAISIIRYFTEILDRKYFNSVDIFMAFKSAVSLSESQDFIVLLKWCLRDTKYSYKINDLLNWSCMENKTYTQMLIQNCKSDCLHLNKTLEAILRSRDFDSLKILLCKNDMFDMHFVITCIWERFIERKDAGGITKWLLENFDPIMFDIAYILKLACYDDNLMFVQWIYRYYGISNITYESIFIHACESTSISILRWINERITHPIDLKKILKDKKYLSSSVVIFLIQNFELDQYDIDKICTLHWRDEKRRLEFKLCIFETYGRDLIDVKSVFENVCRLSSAQEVKWLMNCVDTNMLDLSSAIKEALRGNNYETFIYLFEIATFIDPQEVDGIFIEACRNCNLHPVEFLYKKFGESLSISVAIKELCENKSITPKHFDVFKFLIGLSSPSILDCQLLMNWACKSHDINIIQWLLDFFDPDSFEICSAIYHAFHTHLTTDRKLNCLHITMEFLQRCQWVSSEIQAVMEIACSKEMVPLMELLVKIFGPGSFDFQRIVSISLNPMKKDVFLFALSQSSNLCIDLQTVFVSACKNSESGIIGLLVFLILECGLDKVDIQSIIQTILEIPYQQDFVNKVIKMLLQCQEYNYSKSINIMSVIRKSYVSCFKSSLSKTNYLVLWILRRCRHALIDMPETLLEICKCGDIYSMNYLLHTCNYGNLINASCIQTAFASGSYELIEMMINDFPDIHFDKKVAMNNASSRGDISVVLLLFYKYSVRPNRFPFLEPILDLKLARSTFDLNSAMQNACKNGNTDVVQWLLQIFPYEMFDMRLCLIETSASGNADLVKWMLAVYDNDIFDIETSVMSACAYGNIRNVQFFIEKFGKDAFNMETVVGEACGNGNIELVKWLYKKIDRKLYNIKSAMIMACINNRSDVVRWILNNFDHSYFNMQMATIVACEWGRIKLVKNHQC